MDCSVEKLVALVPRCGMKPSYPVGAGEAFSLTEVPLLRLGSGVIVNIWENEARSKSRDIISTTHPKTFSRGGAKAGRKRSLNGVTSDRAVHKTFGHSGGGGGWVLCLFPHSDAAAQHRDLRRRRLCGIA